jgi:predicted nucleic acid-binding Zn ribbon protein
LASDPLSPTGLALVPHILSYCVFGRPVNARAGRCSVKAKQDSKSAWRRTRRIVALAVLPLVALMMVLTLLSLVLRYGGPRVRDKIRLLNKRVLNPP